VITISSVIGNVFYDTEFAEKFKKLRGTANCELIKVWRSELDKTRFRKNTDKGTDVGMVLNEISKLHNGDVLLSETERLIVIEQIPEKVISINTKKTEKSEKILVTLGHIIGNRHRPIQIENDGRIIFPILSDSEIDVFKKLFSSVIDQIDIKIEERIFEPRNGMDVHEH
jgi:urease accessory protein